MMHLIKIIGFLAILAFIGCRKNTALDLRTHQGAAEALPTETPLGPPTNESASPTPSPSPTRTTQQLLELLPVLLTAGRIQALALLADKPDLKPLVEDIYNYLIDNILLIAGGRDPAQSAAEFVAIVKKWIMPPMKEAEETALLTSVAAAFTQLQTLAKQNPPPTLLDLLGACAKVVEGIPGDVGDNVRKYVSVDAIKVFLGAGSSDSFKNLIGNLNVGSTKELLNLLNNK